MIAFIVTVRQEGQQPERYTDIACDSSTAIMNAQARFGACRVSVRPA